MEAWLLVLNGLEAGSTISVRGDVLIGRSKECSVRLCNLAVSRKHCRIIEKDSAFFMEDLGSTNGTMVNEKKIESEVELKHGDSLRIAFLEFKFLTNDRPRNAKQEIVVEGDEKSTLDNSFFERF